MAVLYPLSRMANVDTSMGLTPLEGLVMGTRSGDIDAGAVTFIMEKEGLNATGVSNLLNKKSGVLGVSGASSDMREVHASANSGNKKAELALNMYFYRLRKYIGSYAAAFGWRRHYRIYRWCGRE